MATSPSRERVTSRLAKLQDSYRGFDVRQTTVSVRSDEFERAVAGDTGLARAAVRVRDAEGRVLCVPDGDGWTDPGGTVDADEPIAETARAAVERQTGIQPSIDGLDRVCIVCITDEDAPETTSVYRLHVRFTGRPVEGALRTETAEWRGDPPLEDEPLF